MTHQFETRAVIVPPAVKVRRVNVVRAWERLEKLRGRLGHLWSDSSFHVLYGATQDVHEALEEFKLVGPAFAKRRYPVAKTYGLKETPDETHASGMGVWDLRDGNAMAICPFIEPCGFRDGFKEELK